jgi:hypothetical protein
MQKKYSIFFSKIKTIKTKVSNWKFENYNFLTKDSQIGQGTMVSYNPNFIF